MRELPSRPADHIEQECPTPRALAKRIVGFFRKRIDTPTSTWLDPCRGDTQAFYQFMPPDRRDWCEIKEGRDFLARMTAADITMSNVPFHSKVCGEFFHHAMALGGRHIIFLLPARAALGLRTRNELARAWGYGHRTVIRLPRYRGNTFTASSIQLVMMHWERGYRGPLDQYDFKGADIKDSGWWHMEWADRRRID